MNQPPPLQPSFAAPYYGPPAYPYSPPPQDHLRRLLAFVIRAFIAICVLLGIAILILWFIYRPQKMHIEVNSASFRSFNLSTSAGERYLSFDFSANITVRNPNNRADIYYDWLEARADYDGHRFALVSLPGFYQSRKETTAVPVSLEGQSAVGEEDGLSVVFDREKSAGLFSVDMWVVGRVRYKFGAALTRRYALRALCQLRVPSGKKGEFSITSCEVLDL